MNESKLYLNKKVRKILKIKPIHDFCLEQFWWTQIIIEKIHWKESEPKDIHGVICETTKLATSDFGICEFDRQIDDLFGGIYGSFSLKGTNSSEEIKCSQLVQTGFQDLKLQTYIPNLNLR